MWPSWDLFDRTAGSTGPTGLIRTAIRRRRQQRYWLQGSDQLDSSVPPDGDEHCGHHPDLSGEPILSIDV